MTLQDTERRDHLGKAGQSLRPRPELRLEKGQALQQAHLDQDWKLMAQVGQLFPESESTGSQVLSALTWGLQRPAVATSLLAPQSPSESPRTQEKRRRPQTSPDGAHILLGR